MGNELVSDDWRESLARWCREHGDALGLSAESLAIRQMANPSGWYGKVVCTISDGSSMLFAKLSEDREELRRTYELREQLVSKYRCPPVFAWIELEDVVGIVMRYIRSGPGSERLTPEVVGLADRLHADTDLAGQLPDEEQPDTMREAFCDTWIERLTSDLDELEGEGKVPPFVSADLVEWMRRETGLLEELIETPAFDEEPTGPVHGDLHLANVLVEPGGAWWLTDWDDLHCGDPAADLSTLLLPLIERGEGVEPLLGSRDARFRERFAVCTRAVLLDLVVDSLADWADADQSPGIADSIRRSMRATHERGLLAYRQRYQTSGRQ